MKAETLTTLVQQWRESADATVVWTNHPEFPPQFVHSSEHRARLKACADELDAALAAVRAPVEALQCGRGHITRQPKCPACHDLVRATFAWMAEPPAIPPTPEPELERRIAAFVEALDQRSYEDDSFYAVDYIRGDGQCGSLKADLLALIAGLRVSGPAFTLPRAREPQPAPTGWQDISTAPKDGTRIICYGPRLMVAECEWRTAWQRDGEGWYRSNQHPIVEPTHWQPLPSPPAALVAVDTPLVCGDCLRRLQPEDDDEKTEEKDHTRRGIDC